MNSPVSKFLREPLSPARRARQRNFALLALAVIAGAAGVLLQESWTAAPIVASVRGSGTTLSVLGDTAKLSSEQKFFLPVAEQLLAQGADAGFVRQLIRDSNLTFYEKLTKITVSVRPPEPKPTVAKKPSRQYAYTQNDIALKKSTEFLVQHDSVLSAAERLYKVPKEAIASILWVETRFGDFLGNYHVPSVYMSYAMATQPDFLQKNKERLKADFSAYHEKRLQEKAEKKKELTQQDTVEVLEQWAAIEEKMMAKAQKKAGWAIAELLALQQMRTVSPVPIHSLRGSWAGAFGLSQFIPSSYVKLAVDGNNDGKINLFDVHDAAHSVGRYLSSAGWGANKKAQQRAVYHYNHSEDYVQAVLGLAKRLSNASTMAKASTKVSIKTAASAAKISVNRTAEKN